MSVSIKEVTVIFPDTAVYGASTRFPDETIREVEGSFPEAEVQEVEVRFPDTEVYGVEVWHIGPQGAPGLTASFTTGSAEPSGGGVGDWYLRIFDDGRYLYYKEDVDTWALMGQLASIQ